MSHIMKVGKCKFSPSKRGICFVQTVWSDGTKLIMEHGKIMYAARFDRILEADEICVYKEWGRSLCNFNNVIVEKVLKGKICNLCHSKHARVTASMCDSKGNYYCRSCFHALGCNPDGHMITRQFQDY